MKSNAFQENPLRLSSIISDSLKAEIDLTYATTKAHEELSARKTEVKCAATSAAYKQMQMYRRQRKEILKKLIQEKKDYISLLKQKIEELDNMPDVSSSYNYSSTSYTQQ